MIETTARRYYRAPDGSVYRVRIVSDEDAISPRDADNATVIQLTRQHELTSPDEGYVKRADMVDIPGAFITESERVDMRRFGRYVNLFCSDLGIIAMAGIDVANDWRPTLRLRLFHTDADAEAEYDGIIAITHKSWAMTMGATVSSATRCEEIMAEEIESFNRWARGEYVGVIIERREEWINPADHYPVRYSWEEIQSLWGIDGEEYATEEAAGMLPDCAVRDDSIGKDGSE